MCRSNLNSGNQLHSYLKLMYIFIPGRGIHTNAAILVQIPDSRSLVDNKIRGRLQLVATLNAQNSNSQMALYHEL
jgi:hypothetical protein